MKILALLFCLIGAGMAVVAGFMAMFSPMAMDAPGSEKSIFSWIFIGLLLIAPVVFIATDIIAWRQFSLGNYGKAIIWVLMGFVPFVAAFLSLFLIGK